MTNDKEKENIGVMRNKENQQNGNVFMMANVQNYVKFLAQWAKNTVNKTEHDLNVWKKFFHNISENSEIEEIAADKLKYLGLPFYDGHTENKNAYKPTTIPSFQRSLQHFSNDKNSKITTCL